MEKTQKDILQFWHACELFTPQGLPKIDASRKTALPVYAIPEKSMVTPMPWEAGHTHYTRKPRTGCAWRYTVFAGLYEVKKQIEQLETIFGSDEYSEHRDSSEESAILCFSCSAEGQPVYDSLVISSSAWATGRALKKSADDLSWLSGFDDFSEEAVELMRAALPAEEEPAAAADEEQKPVAAGKPIDLTKIQQFAQKMAQQMGITDLVDTTTVRVGCTQVANGKDMDASEDAGFLNSMLANDIHKVLMSELGKGMSQYLQSEKNIHLDGRCDTANVSDYQFEQLSPNLFPIAKWPGQGRHPLVFSQQLAVNTLMQEMSAGAGLGSVNGPPGTGKTTLLRDIIAAIYVERAKHIALLDSPEAAFTGSTEWKKGQYTQTLYTLAPQLAGYEMVVASSNNGAVENISFEIPAVEAIDESVRNELDHFAELATRILGKPSWGLFSAALGKKSNRNKFVSNFWFDGKEEKPENADTGMLTWLKAMAEKEQPSWDVAVAEFNRAVSAEKAIRDERNLVFSYMRQVPVMEARLADLSLELDDIKEEVETTRHTIESAKEEIQRIGNTLYDLREKLEGTRCNPAGLLAQLPFVKFIVCLLHRWRQTEEEKEEISTLGKEISCAENQLEEQEKIKSTAATCNFNASQEQRRLSDEKNKLTREINLMHSHITQARFKLGSLVPDHNTWPNDVDEREKSSPWMDATWNEARENVFVAALRLHKALISHNARAFRSSLSVAMDVVGGNADNLANGLQLAAWQNLFMVVPVVSSTFSSYGRMFEALGKESLGYLMIDEAGQGTPQSAVGAIWRARHTITVGDPLQLEPVVSMPVELQRMLAKHWNVSEEMLPGATSIQRLADQTNRYGTYLQGQNGEKIWVGLPLRVHRRCHDPMFSIANQVAYGGAMVHGIAKHPNNTGLPDSGWIDVRGTQTKEHWLEEEGEAIKQLVALLKQRGADVSKIFAISPFKSVVVQLARLNLGVQAGTIHTVQGKEADVVIFVLGGNPDKIGAKKWAADKPNLLNVAVSRAKKHLYVIGNRNLWKVHNYFSLMSVELPDIDLAAYDTKNAGTGVDIKLLSDTFIREVWDDSHTEGGHGA